VDVAGDPAGNPTLSKSGTLVVRGWAADTATGAPVQSVTVRVDGVNVGTAILGGARPDVAQAYGRSDFTNSGWTFQTSAGFLSVGQHSVTAIATGPSGTAPLAGSKNITITSGQEVGVVDVVGDSVGNPTLSTSGTLVVRGWAADTATGAPVQSVTVLVDGVSVGTAALGDVRPDVAQAYGRSDFTNSGWTFQASAGFLSVGQHSVTASATGPSGTAPLAGSKTVTITSGH